MSAAFTNSEFGRPPSEMNNLLRGVAQRLAAAPCVPEFAAESAADDFATVLRESGLLRLLEAADEAYAAYAKTMTTQAKDGDRVRFTGTAEQTYSETPKVVVPADLIRWALGNLQPPPLGYGTLWYEFRLRRNALRALLERP